MLRATILLAASLWVGVAAPPPKRNAPAKPELLIASQERWIYYYHWATPTRVVWMESKRGEDFRFQALGYDLGRGVSILADNLKRNERRGFDNPYIGEWRFSPDGRYLLYFDKDDNRTFRRLVDVSQRPPVEKEYPDSLAVNEPELLWFANSAQWAEFYVAPTVLQVKIRSVQDSKEQTLSIRGDFGGATPIGLTRNGDLALYEQSKRLMHVSIKTPALPVKSFKYPLPYSDRTYVDFAQKGERLLWTLTFHKKPQAPLLFSASFPRPGEFQEWVAYYTTRLDGGDAKAIGACYINTGANERGFDWDMVRGRWLPDAKAFSFYYQGALYRVRLQAKP